MKSNAVAVTLVFIRTKNGNNCHCCGRSIPPANPGGKTSKQGPWTNRHAFSLSRGNFLSLAPHCRFGTDLQDEVYPAGAIRVSRMLTLFVREDYAPSLSYEWCSSSWRRTCGTILGEPWWPRASFVVRRKSDANAHRGSLGPTTGWIPLDIDLEWRQLVYTLIWLPSNAVSASTVQLLSVAFSHLRFIFSRCTDRLLVFQDIL